MSATVVFSIAEIVRMICAFLEDDKQSLFSLVCCNRAASETALDVLWAKLDSIEPFIPFIPGRLLEACSDIDINAEAFFQLPCPPAEEWKSFDKYACRVKDLHSADPNEAWVDGTRLIYPRLAALRARDGFDLFPNLRSILCFLSEPGLHDKKLLPSNLRSLTSFTRNYGMDADGHTNTLIQMASHTPFLEQLHLRGVFHFPVTEQIQPLRLACLREVDLTRASISYCDFQYLCKVLCESPVATFSVHLRKPLAEWKSALPVFPVLRRLVFCGDPTIAHDFLERLSKSTLADFTIEHEDCMAELNAYGSLLDLLHKRFSDSLKSVHINIGDPPINAHHFLAYTLVALIPLVEAGVEELRYTMYIDVLALPEMLQQALDPCLWPTLRVFSFSTQSQRLSRRQLEESRRIWAPFFQQFAPVWESVPAVEGADSDV